MAAKAPSIVLLTDSLLGENRYPKGTGLTVIDKPLGELGEGEVDVTTAAAWKRLGWAADAKPAAKAARGGDVD
jgi:hypothetical protein